ncbi:14034_t:CDS:2 [Acaulospora colombiana]|uniref:14034_t:CDS:1 n=1 Tax=Acaulospora colombiana TaxID=27376 RepID=A0ACA9KUK7_9GLOM|nr:14034_t:CDS:2 [Acaulospora colombiana]
MNSVLQVEELVKEYLLVCFLTTFRSFEQECKNDKNKGFQAERIIDELYSFVANSDINGLLDYWKYLDLRYFSRLDVRFLGSVKKFETCLLRYYLVYAIQQKRKDKVLMFFDTFGAELSKNSEWSKWFGRSSSSLSSLRSTQNNKAETGSENNGMKSPETLADDRSMTPISEYNSDDTQELPGEDANPFTIMSQVRQLSQILLNIQIQ